MTFTQSWIGYDLPADAIEAHPAVQTLRGQGIEKRGAREYHLAVASFDSVELEAMNALVAKTEEETGTMVGEAVLAFDGYGLIEGAEGRYAYFSPSSGGAKAAGDLKARVVALPAYDTSKNCRDLHVTIGGPDPLSAEKPKRGPLKQPLEAKARLALAGHDGKAWRRFFWNEASKSFLEDVALVEEKKKEPAIDPEPAREVKDEPKPAEPPKPQTEASVPDAEEKKPEAKPIIEAKLEVKPAEAIVPAPQESKPAVEEKKPEPRPPAEAKAEPKPVESAPAPKPAVGPVAIKAFVLPAKVMPDTACAVYLLRAYGAKLFPGAAEAQLSFAAESQAASYEALLKEGTLVIERRGESAAAHFAKLLGIADRPELKKLLAFAKRDSEKKGTLSSDPLDRAFGITGVAMMMNRVYAEDPRATLEFLTSVFAAHAYDESRRPAA